MKIGLRLSGNPEVIQNLSRGMIVIIHITTR